MLRERLIQELRNESGGEPMPVTTIRIPAETHREIVEFAQQHNLRVAAVLRRCATEGWERLKEDL